MITCRERVKAWESFDKSYQVPNILLVCYSEETAVNWTFRKEPEINLNRTSSATKITEHPSDSATDNTNCLNTYGALLVRCLKVQSKNTNPTVNGAYVSVKIFNKLKNIYLLCTVNDCNKLASSCAPTKRNKNKYVNEKYSKNANPLFKIEKCLYEKFEVFVIIYRKLYIYIHLVYTHSVILVI